MYTGLQLSKDLDIRVRQSKAAAFLSPARKAYCLRMGIIKQIEKHYRYSSTQASVDEISPLIKTYKTFPVNNNQVLLKPLHINSIVLASGTTFTITFDRNHNLPSTWTGSITLSGIEGTLLFSDLNGIRIATYLNATSVQVTVAGITGVHTANTGQATSNDNSWISDYYHLLAVSVNSKKLLDIVIKKVVVTSPLQITIGTNNLRDGEYLYFANFGGLTGLNGNRYIKKVGERKIRIYDDKDLTTPTVVTGSYTSGGTISRYYSRGCEPLVSDQKIGYYGATELFPLYESNENRLSCYTSDVNLNTNVTQLTYLVDYITTTADIDTTDNVYDLLQVYNMNMINSIIEEAARVFFNFTESAEAIQTTALPQ